jgi:hypothetical protein
MPHDRESLLAAWEAIGSSHPFPDELQGVCLAYLNNLQLHGRNESNIVLTPSEEEFSSPPTRYIRQPRAIKRYPTGPVRADGTSGSLPPAGTCVSTELNVSTELHVEFCEDQAANGPDRVVDGPKDDQPC